MTAPNGGVETNASLKVTPKASRDGHRGAQGVGIAIADGDSVARLQGK